MKRPLQRAAHVMGAGAIFVLLGVIAAIEDEASRTRALLGASAVGLVGGVAVLDASMRRTRRSEAELASTRAFLHALLEATSDAVFVKDAAGRYLLVNPAGVDLLGRPVGEILGSDDAALLAEQSAEAIMESDARVMREGVRWSGEEVAIADGATRTYEATKSPVRDEAGEVVGLVGVWRDVTQRKSEDAARLREVLRLLELNEMLQACRGLDEAYEVLEKLVPPFFPDVSGTVCLFDASRSAVEVRASFGAGPGASAPSIFAPDDCWALRRGQPHAVEEPNALHCRHVGEPSPAKTLCLPLLAHGQVLGILHLASEDAIHDDTHHRALLLGEQLSMALANLELREVLRNQSIRDPLTGLYNRRYAEAALEQELLRAEREDGLFAVLLMDVDHFKRFNDSYGHEAGDEVLRAIARTLGQQIRGSDVASRIGGEELLVLLPGAPLEAARKKAEDLRAAIARLEVEHLGANVGRVTVSIGVASYPWHGARVDELLRVADEALYRAKRAGRDRVVVADERRTQRGFRVTRTS